ncbi:hypothetical protein V6N13_042683 [Hibiscus sabdariffa]
MLREFSLNKSRELSPITLLGFGLSGLIAGKVSDHRLLWWSGSINHRGWHPWDLTRSERLKYPPDLNLRKNGIWWLEIRWRNRWKMDQDTKLQASDKKQGNPGKKNWMHEEYKGWSETEKNSCWRPTDKSDKKNLTKSKTQFPHACNNTMQAVLLHACNNTMQTVLLHACNACNKYKDTHTHQRFQRMDRPQRAHVRKRPPPSTQIHTMSINDKTKMMKEIKFTEEENIVLDNIAENNANEEGRQRWLVGKVLNTKKVETEYVLRVFRKVLTDKKTRGDGCPE